MSLGRSIRGARVRAGLTQQALAGRAGVSLATIQNLEAGRANPSVGTLSKVLEPLGLEIDLAPAPVDWDALVAHGLPLAPSASAARQTDGERLATLVRHAALDLSRVPGPPEDARKRDAVRALLLAMRIHFPGWFRESFGRSSLVRDLVPEDPSGRILKLARIARQRLAEIL
jgi:transcriptional regulator with XRE-family HTH domain